VSILHIHLKTAGYPPLMSAICISKGEEWVTIVTRPICGMRARSATISSIESTPVMTGL
jgi:hypothetical protein